MRQFPTAFPAAVLATIGFGEQYSVNLNFDGLAIMRLSEACAKVGLPVMFHMDQNK